VTCVTLPRVHPYLDVDGPIAFAHRGGAGLPGNEGLENTLVAFRRAVDLGYAHLETDVRATRDGVVYLCHDADLLRLAGAERPIAAMLEAEVRRLRVGDREPFVRLADVLEELPDVRLNIDLKSDDVVDPALDLLRRADALDRVCLGSFSTRRIQRARAAAPQALTSFAGTEVAAFRLSPVRRWREAGVRRGARCLQVPRTRGPLTVVDRRFVERAHAAGCVVHVWTIDDPTAMHELLDLGVDGIVTDRPDVLKDVLVQRGQWKDPR
jgi:glycerophosphoryl diester phosphodiesterase